jgi:hypothetical protein
VSEREKMERLDRLSPHEDAPSTSLQTSKPNGKDAALCSNLLFQGPAKELRAWIADAPQYDEITFVGLKVDEEQTA